MHCFCSRIYFSMFILGTRCEGLLFRILGFWVFFLWVENAVLPTKSCCDIDASRVLWLVCNAVTHCTLLHSKCSAAVLGPSCKLELQRAGKPKAKRLSKAHWHSRINIFLSLCRTLRDPFMSWHFTDTLSEKWKAAVGDFDFCFVKIFNCERVLVVVWRASSSKTRSFWKNVRTRVWARSKVKPARHDELSASCRSLCTGTRQLREETRFKGVKGVMHHWSVFEIIDRYSRSMKVWREF